MYLNFPLSIPAGIQLVALVHFDWRSCTESLTDAKNASLQNLSTTMTDIRIKYSLEFLSHLEAEFYAAAREKLGAMSVGRNCGLNMNH